MHRYAVAGLAFVGLAFLTFFSPAQEQLPVPEQLPGAEVQARGPVHEAFAEPISDQPTQGTVVTKAPPAPIDELPPDEKPAGTNVQWLPGYWAWDADTSNFLWVSGCWRDVPPDRQWLPGHWQEIAQGWVWISGYWAPANLQQVQYLPPPPPTVEAGPSMPAPDPTSTYVGGNWIYVTNTYRWQPGHWIAYQPGWTWVPAHYVWTPIGCVFVAGYWDHPLELRGLLFAPVRFDLAIWQALRRPFVPAFCIHSDFLLGALFVGPHTRHYYFGDYFEPRYAQRGFVAWPDYQPRRGMVDPNFAYYRHVHAADPAWTTSLRNLYTARREGTVARPPRTLVQQVQEIKNITINNTTNKVVHNTINLTHVQNLTALTPLNQVRNLNVTGLSTLTPGRPAPTQLHTIKLETVPKVEQARAQQAATQARALAAQRHATEAKLLGGGNIPVRHTDAPHTVQLPVAAPVVVPKVAPTPKVVATPKVVPTPPVVVPHPAPRVVPALPKMPPHVEHAIPKYEPRPAVQPPKKR